LTYKSCPVYYADQALKLNLPPRSQFSKKNAPELARALIKYARRMLANEQLRESAGGEEEGDLLVKQLIGTFFYLLCAFIVLI
jgi:hypothetical protein